MKLDDFLKCKKVRCVDGDAPIITTGKVYDVIGLDKTFIHVTDDNGEEAYYWYSRFEPVLDSAENPLQDMKLTPEFESAETVLVYNCEVNTQDNSVNTQDNSVNIQDTPKFRVGDPVYWGLKSRIFKVYRLMTANVLQVELDDCVVDVHKDELCPATLENYGKLCSLFECIDFEQPPKPLTGSDLCRAMLEKGWNCVPCYMSNVSENEAIELGGEDSFYVRIAHDFHHSFGFASNGKWWDHAVPFDPRTGEPLTESVLDE